MLPKIHRLRNMGTTDFGMWDSRFWNVGTTGMLQSYPFTRHQKHEFPPTTMVNVPVSSAFPGQSTTMQYKEAGHMSHCSHSQSLLLLPGLPQCNKELRLMMACQETKLEEPSG
jgi:hypothetical protein